MATAADRSTGKLAAAQKLAELLVVPASRPTIPKLPADDKVEPAPRSCSLVDITEVLHPQEGQFTCSSGQDHIELRMESIELNGRLVGHHPTIATTPRRGRDRTTGVRVGGSAGQRDMGRDP